MNKQTTPNTPNYELIIIDRYNIADSQVVIVTEEFIVKFEEMIFEQTGIAAASIGSDYTNYEGMDDEEHSYIWTKTDKQLNAESKEFMSDYEDEEDEDEDEE